MRLTIRDCSEYMGDWWVIERAEHDGRQWLEDTGPDAQSLRCSSRFSDADVEGCSSEMLAVAAAIETRASVGFKRCRVRVDGDRVFFRSPRNSRQDGECSLAEADELAKLIRERVRLPEASSANV